MHCLTLFSTHTDLHTQIFPYYIHWNFYRNYHGLTGWLVDEVIAGKVKPTRVSAHSSIPQCAPELKNDRAL